MASYIINELLSYCIFYMDNSTIANIKKVVISFYTAEEIVAAKKDLWNHCCDKLEAYVERKNSNKRSGSDAHLSDIFDALTKLDCEKATPQCLVKNIDRLPKYKAEDINLLSILERLNDLEKKLNSH